MERIIKKYKIGTRGSLLALTQCLQVKNQLEAISDHQFELKIISTEGDENTTLPLWQMDGKDFFTKELDHALLGEEVDMVVHSYKDLGSDRPGGITLAAITERKFPHDILLIKKTTVKKLAEKELKKFIVGTSSPRRMRNLEKGLRDFLPNGKEVALQIETKALRGNVNTRIEKLRDDQFDAIVLALPGIERLAKGLPDKNNEAFQKYGNPTAILEELLNGITFMILPLTTFPAAASQGALGVEVKEDRDDELEEVLKKLNHQKTIREVKREREIFQKFGGGCHLAVGITVTECSNLICQNVLGEVDQKEYALSGIYEPRAPFTGKSAFLGINATSGKTSEGIEIIYDEYLEKKVLPSKQDLKDANVLITNRSAIQTLTAHRLSTDQIIYASGEKTMKALADAGLWCHGCANSWGEDFLNNLTSSHLITLMNGKKDWKVLTNNDDDSDFGKHIKVYEKVPLSSLDEEYIKRVQNCDVYYWTSFNQYIKYNDFFQLKKQAIHCTGIGKTYSAFLEHDIDVLPFASMREFKEWINGKRVIDINKE